MKTLESLKMNAETEISYNEAKELLKNTLDERDFDNLNESTISETVEFECVQNRKYYVTKIGKKGSKLYEGSEYETGTNVGVFQIEMTWDYKHPSNFALNQNNVSSTFTISI
jgi:hypothetical protein